MFRTECSKFKVSIKCFWVCQKKSENLIQVMQTQKIMSNKKRRCLKIKDKIKQRKCVGSVKIKQKLVQAKIENQSRKDKMKMPQFFTLVWYRRKKIFLYKRKIFMNDLKFDVCLSHSTKTNFQTFEMNAKVE